MKKFFFSLLAVAAVSLTSCSDDDSSSSTQDDGPSSEVEITKSGNITADETWTADHIYILDGKVIVDDGVTLTIEPGTIVKGEEGQETLASALVVDQGGKLMAEGTADEPIIFTSVLDNITVGEKAGTSLSLSDAGLWGGVIILGKAPISVAGDLTTGQIEGIPANEPYGQYGGNEPNDNSGKLSYISIRHGGITIGDDNEINGLTLGGVGNGTSIKNIEIVANQDDGIEYFGGTVSPSNILIWGQGDDGLDIDQAYSGTITNAVVILKTDAGSALEIDGPEGSSATEGAFTMNNITLIGANTDSKYADLRDGAMGHLNNILAYNFSADSKVNIADEDSQAEFDGGNITFSNWEVVLPTGANIDGMISGDFLTDITGFTNNVTAITAEGNATVGANLSVFGWTYAKAESAF